jgi:hypothetical protein
MPYIRRKTKQQLRQQKERLFAYISIGFLSLAITAGVNQISPLNSEAEARGLSSLISPEGGLLPSHRIVAYYGNFYSARMGALGQYPPAEMTQRLQNEIDKWNAADPSVPAIAGIDYIAVVAQHDAGRDGKYRMRMPASEIDKAIALANQMNGITILDVQVGLSDVQTEIPLLESYLKQPNVMLAIDPEFSMKNGDAPGKRIGTFDAADINYVSEYLAKLVQENGLPPKVLVVHRFTKGMLTNYQNIKLRPEVQIVMDMDGWGFPAKKVNTYKTVIAPEYVQYTGFKLFYINDLKPPSTALMTPEEILELSPKPLYILFQ